MAENTTWIEYSRLVLDHIQQQVQTNKQFTEEIATLRVGVGKLEVRAGIAGAIGGLIGGGFFALLVNLLSSHLK
jgi:hypothetical protein